MKSSRNIFFLILLLISPVFIFSVNVKASPLYRLRNLDDPGIEIVDTPPFDPAVEGGIKEEILKSSEEDVEKEPDKDAEIETVEDGVSSPGEVEEKKEIKEEEPPADEPPPPLPSPLIAESLTTAPVITTSPEKKRVSVDTFSDTGEEKILAAAELSGPPAADKTFISWGYIAVAVFLLTGIYIIWWKRRPREIKIFHDTTTSKANEYFRDHFSRYDVQKNWSSPPPVVPENNVSENSYNSSGETCLSSGYDDKELKKMGIDPKYKQVLRLYYLRGLDPEHIARQTGRGPGETGLVIDLVNRFRKKNNISVVPPG